MSGEHVAAQLPATADAASPSMSTSATRAPSATSRVAVARPMPEAPPVTITTRSCSPFSDTDLSP